MKVLQIHYYFPPIHFVGTVRNSKVYSYFKQRSNEHPTVLTTNNHSRFPSDDYGIDWQKGSVKRLHTIDYRTVLQGRGSGSISEAQKGKFIKGLTQLIHSFPFLILFGEGSLIYIIHGVLKGAKELRKRSSAEPILLWSSFPPWADHLVAYLLKSFFPKRAIWAADFRDLFIEPVYKTQIWPNLQKKVMRKILAKADYIITVSDGLASNLSKHHPNVKVVMNSLHDEFADNESLDRSVFRITYTGSLWRGDAKPDVLFAALRQILAQNPTLQTDLQLHYAGRDGQLWDKFIQEAYLSSHNRNHGEVGWNEAKELQKKSSINLHFTSSHPEQQGMVGGKFFELVAASRWMMMFSEGEPDPYLDALIADTGNGYIYYSQDTSPATLIQNITTIYQMWKQGNYHVNSDKAYIFEKYSFTAQMNRLINDIKEKHSSTSPAHG